MPTRLPADTPARARTALRAAADGERRVLDALFYGRAAPFFSVWGAVWAAGFVATGLGVASARLVWGTAVALGWAGTAALVLARRGDGRGNEATASRYAASAAVVSVHAASWATLLLWHAPNAVGIYAGSVTGCAYVVAGLWRGPLLVVLGLGVSALFLAGLALPAALFPFYAGALGGGGLVAAGVLLGRADPS